MQAVLVTITNPVSGFTRTATTDVAGRYVFNNLSPNPYHLAVTAQGFQTLERDVDVRTGVPITVDLSLALAGASSSVEVVGHNEDLLERSPTAHTDVDQTLIAKLPIESSAGGLNQVVTLASPGVGGRLERVLSSRRRPRTDAVLDRQSAITDQQSRVYSNQISQGRRAVHGDHHGGGTRRIWRQEQSGRAYRDQIGARPGAANWQRVVRLRLVHESDWRG
jgi:hypothetical protein